MDTQNCTKAAAGAAARAAAWKSIFEFGYGLITEK
jgi:hypothetical protein